LLCCLKYEDEAYTIEKRRFPKLGSRVRFEDKIVKVIGLNVISDLVKIDYDGNISFVSLNDIKILPPKDHKNEQRGPLEDPLGNHLSGGPHHGSRLPGCGEGDALYRIQGQLLSDHL